ncbi:disease resistance protein SUMM2-like [Dioscorea cayenensis subsp. rotundata]|uniref:Disease resistance protein SUMM2-like n=1 Tax=Dioscorea cayennensis subsp. rotundata TaxID=55577 RepID=A0AB40AP03_DIOCR|nr:disease resistance protein SUMM2-like [Dioscorea cayenensis subsp. rotundata]
MKVDKKVKVECLDGEEAWHLFMQHANEEIINSNVVIKKLARKVMERSRSLPLCPLKSLVEPCRIRRHPKSGATCLKLLIKVDIKTVTRYRRIIVSQLKVGSEQARKETELISFKGTNFNKTLQKLLSDQNIDEKGQVSCASTSPRYPNLQSLFLEGYSKSDHMSRQFVVNVFPHMPSLTHLNLSGIPITGLSKEIRVLVNLRYINISNTKIQSLPSELKELKELKYFLFRCKYYRGRGVLKVDGLSTLSMLPKLQVLDLYGNTCLEADDLRLLMERNRIKGISMLVELVEILGLLKHLPTWKIRLHSMQNMHTLQFCDLSYKHDEGLMELGITQCGFKELLINGSGVSLKRINLGNIAKLRQISWPARTLPSEGLPRLTSLYISYCDSLRSLSWVLHLPCLRTLSVKSCSGMEELIDPAEMQQASSGLPTFPSLQSLSLSLMAKLVSLSTCPLDFPVLSKLTLFECSKLKKLSFKSSIINNKFQLVEVDKKCWEDLEWEDTTIRSHLASFSKTL